MNKYPGYQPKETGEPQGEPPHCGSSATQGQDPLEVSQAEDVLATVRTLVVNHSVTCQELIDGMTYVAQISDMGLKLRHVKGAMAQKFVNVHREPVEAKHCTCHERDGSYVCDYCYEQGHRGHMQT